MVRVASSANFPEEFFEPAALGSDEIALAVVGSRVSSTGARPVRHATLFPKCISSQNVFDHNCLRKYALGQQLTGHRGGSELLKALR